MLLLPPLHRLRLAALRHRRRLGAVSRATSLRTRPMCTTLSTTQCKRRPLAPARRRLCRRPLPRDGTVQRQPPHRDRNRAGGLVPHPRTALPLAARLRVAAAVPPVASMRVSLRRIAGAAVARRGHGGLSAALVVRVAAIAPRRHDGLSAQAVSSQWAAAASDAASRPSGHASRYKVHHRHCIYHHRTFLNSRRRAAVLEAEPLEAAHSKRAPQPLPGARLQGVA